MNNNDIINKKRNDILEFYYDDLSLANNFSAIISNFYNELNNNINVNNITQEYISKKEMYPLKTKLNFNDTIEIATNFFNEINVDFTNYFKMRMHDQNNITFGDNPKANADTRKLELTKYGDLRDLYTISHEFTHLFDSKNNNLETRRVLTETCAQSMERLLDSYLLNLTDEQLLKYNIDKKILQEDILNRRISTFSKRINSIYSINNYRNFNEKAIDSGYMLAQIYSTNFSTLPYNQQKDIINNLINNVNCNNFENAVNLFKLDLSKNNNNRNNILQNIIENIYNDYELKIQLEENKILK